VTLVTYTVDMWAFDGVDGCAVVLQLCNLLWLVDQLLCVFMCIVDITTG